MGKYVEMTVLVPVSQYVKVEAEAKGDSRSLESTASFLLSEWVLATQGHSTKPSLAVRPATGKGRWRGTGRGRVEA